MFTLMHRNKLLFFILNMNTKSKACHFLIIYVGYLMMISVLRLHSIGRWDDWRIGTDLEDVIVV
jgi:hypothetical protein